MKKNNLLFMLCFVIFQTQFFGQNYNYDFQKTIDTVKKSVTITYQISPDIVFYKIINKNTPIYYLSIYSEIEFAINGKGVYFLLDDNFQIQKPNQIVDLTFHKNNVFHHAFIELSKSELELFKKAHKMQYMINVTSGYVVYDPKQIDHLISSN